MKQHIQSLVEQSLQQLKQQGFLAADLPLPEVHIEHARDKQFGDFACNIAMLLGKRAKMNPRQLAEHIVRQLPTSHWVSKTDIAGPGFINFYMTDDAKHQVLHDIFKLKNQFGLATVWHDKKIHMEFVSANPTGPLHAGHGRWAAFGAACANLLEAIGAKVHREYYVNDAGRQMNILAVSVWLRYLALCGETFTFPNNGYKGQYVKDIAQGVLNDYQQQYCKPAADVFADIPADATDDGQGDKEQHIDALIQRGKTLLGDEGYRIFHQRALDVIIDDIRTDLSEFGIDYDEWFSERTLFNDNLIYKTIDRLREAGHTYELDGNLWFRSTAFGDDKDRVLIRKNGEPTYFAVDVSYHLSKFQRGATDVIDVLGADHHGYISRISAAVQALGFAPEQLTFLIGQFATLYRGKERVQMSTRSGEFVTLRELREEVGKDAARFFYVMRKNDLHLEFDIDLAKSESSDNPVYYIQYAHARICSIQRQLAEKGWTWQESDGLAQARLLTEPQELALLETLEKYPETILYAGTHYEPHVLAQYLRELATCLHSYYNALPFLVEDTALRHARLALVFATKHVLANGSSLLGISTPEVM